VGKISTARVVNTGAKDAQWKNCVWGREADPAASYSITAADRRRLPSERMKQAAQAQQPKKLFARTL